jgi:hypothetical protein
MSETKPSRPHPSEFKPVVLLDSSAALVYTHMHPFLLASGFYLRFNELTEDPVATELELLPVVAVIQALWCMLCLPAYAKKEEHRKDGKEGLRKKPKQRVRFEGDRRRDDIALGYKMTVCLPCISEQF